MRDPKAIRKAIMTAKSLASLVDPKFARVPLPDLGVSAPEVYVPEHSPAMHEAFGVPMPKQYAGGGDVYGDNSKIRIVGSHEGEHRLVPISPKNTNYQHVMEYVPIKWLLERRGNEYRHSPERMAQLRREIEEEGLREPVLISVGKNSRTAITGEGNHRVLAAHQLGYTHIPVRAMVGDAAGSDVFPEGAHDEDIIPKPNKYFPSEAKPSRVMRSLGYEGQEELPERWWDEGYAAGGEVEDNRAAFLEGNHPLVPHVVYHGTDRNITQFDTEQPRRVDAGGGDTTDTGWYSKGHYFTPSPEAASNFASNYAITGEHGPNVMPVHLSLKNPFIVKVPRHSSGATDMDTALDRAGAPRSSDERLIAKGRGERLPSEQTKILREMGHDGVIVMHQFGHKDEETARQAEERARMADRLHKQAADEYYDAFGDHDNPDRLEAAKDAFIKTRKAANEAREAAGGEYRPAEFVVFEPHQVKSASGNRGTFDRSNPDIRYAAGGEVEDENPYAQPNDLGLYSHAAATAAGLPQERGTPEQFRGMLLNKGVKPAELEWSGFDGAFADQPQVTRQQIAEHFHANRPPVQEKRFQELPSVNELNALRRKHLDEVRDYQAKVRETPDFDPGGERWKRLQYWHQAEKRELLSKYDRPHHETYTIPGGENYREILLKHGGEEGFKGVPVHFKGEPNVLTSLMVKDREDAEGSKVLHLDELQSDWAQKGRQTGFDEPQDQREIYTIRYPDGSTEYGVRGLAEARRAAEEGGGEYELSMTKPAKGIDRAPYVTKTEDWVDLGLKRALREAAEGGHDKLAWSPGKTIADRYDLAKHVGDIHHEKNDDGTYNLIVRGHDGETILKEDDWKPEKVADYFGKGVAERILAGEGESGKEAYDRHFAARDRYNNFLDMAADKLADKEVEHLSGDDREIFHKHAKRVYKNGLERQPAELLGEIGLLDDYKDVSWDLQDAEKALKEAPYYSPYRDWRRLSNLDLQVGEKWPFEMYDRMIPKRLLKLAKQHDPEAKLEKSVISHKADHDMYEFYPEDEYGNASDEPANPHPMTQTELHAIRITPKMRESILKRGFPAYAQGGEVEDYAGGGEIDPELFKQYMKRIHSPLSEDPESVRKALQIAGSYRAPVGMETGVGSLYNIKQSLPASAVTRTIQDIPGVNLKPQKKGSWEDFYDLAKGNEFVNVGGDLSGFGRLTHINGKELAWPVDLHAGADYMREPNPGRVWANIGAHATGFQTKIREANERGKELYGILSPMGPSAVNSSHNMFDTLMAQIPNAEIDPDHLKEFDEAIKRGDHLNPKIKRNPKLFASYLKKLEKWPGLEDAKEVSEFARPWRGNLTGAHRADIVKFMDKSYWRDRGFPEVGVTRAAITNPDLLGAGGNKLGYRVVKLSADPTKGDKSIFKHSTYPVDTFGEYVMDVPLVQRHYAQPDVIERLIKSPTKAGQIVHPYSEDPMGRSTARKLFEEQKQIQPVTQRFLDSVMTGMENQEKYGFKKGGSVRKALMIAKSTKKK